MFYDDEQVEAGSDAETPAEETAPEAVPAE